MQRSIQNQINHGDTISSSSITLCGEQGNGFPVDVTTAAELIQRQANSDVKVTKSAKSSDSIQSISSLSSSNTLTCESRYRTVLEISSQHGEAGAAADMTMPNNFDEFAANSRSKDMEDETTPMSDESNHWTSTPTITEFKSPSVLVGDDVIEDSAVKSDEEKGDRSTQSLKEYTRAEWLALFSVCYVNFASNASFTILSAFFGREALAHGATNFEIGIIFGSFAIINAICCPIYGYLVPLFGPKPMLLFGMMLSSACSFLFSQIRLITLPWLFVAACFTCRSIQALGCSAYFIGASVILVRVWRRNMTFAVGVCEVFTGLGMISGPLLGGCLYQRGGFQLPFLVAGVIMLGGIFVAYFTLQNEPGTAASGNVLSLILIPNVAVTLIFMCIMWAAMDFNMPTLALHMEHLKAPPVLVGAMFLIMAAAYTLTAPVVGLMAKTKAKERISMIFGSVLTGISYLLIGPSPVFASIHFFKEVSISSISISMVFLGVGLSAALVPTFSDLAHSAINGGMEDTIATSGLVGGVFNGATFFGEFVGPAIEGALMDKYKDYKTVSSIFAVIIFILIACVGTFYLADWHNSHRARKCYKELPHANVQPQRVVEDGNGQH